VFGKKYKPLRVIPGGFFDKKLESVFAGPGYLSQPCKEETYFKQGYEGAMLFPFLFYRRQPLEYTCRYL
jgi:hypothetical protein